MSVLNLGLQSIGIVRRWMDEEKVAVISNCNSVSEIQKAAKYNPSLQELLLDSVTLTKTSLYIFFNSKIKAYLNQIDLRWIHGSSRRAGEICEPWMLSNLLIQKSILITLASYQPTISYESSKLSFLTVVARDIIVFETKRCGEFAHRLCKPHMNAVRKVWQDQEISQSSYRHRHLPLQAFWQSIYGTIVTKDHHSSKSEESKWVPLHASLQNVKKVVKWGHPKQR